MTRATGAAPDTLSSLSAEHVGGAAADRAPRSETDGTKNRGAVAVPCRRLLAGPADRGPLGTAGRICLVLATAAGVAAGPLPAFADPGTPANAQDAAALVAVKAHDLEQLTERLNSARDQLGRQQAAVQAATEVVAQSQTRLAAARQQVGGIARSAYVGGGQSGFAALLTSDSAGNLVQRASTLKTIAEYQNAILGYSASAADTAAQAQVTARKAAADAKATYDAVSAQQAQLQARVTDYQAQFLRLSAQEKRAFIDIADGGASRTDRPVVASSQAAQIAVNTALAQRGKPYSWGAAGPDSFDCSGLVLFSYQAAGISLPHSAANQATMGRPVTRAELQPGDLIAFYNPVSHIGIYIGNGQMVHAPTSGDVVKVASIDAVGTITAMRRIAG